MGEAALALLIATINHAGVISAAMKRAHDEGRELNAQDWADIDARDQTAAARQLVELARAKAEGR